MKGRFYILLTLLALLSMHACRDDDFSFSSDVVLEFSADTLRMDTVFTERGSATYVLKIYNPSDENVRIQSVKLVDDTGFFRINVDGINANEVSDVPIYAKDSIYVFCEVTIDPDQPVSISPFVVNDRIEFVTNENRQEVILEAWGQNANYFPSRDNQKSVSLLTCDFGEIVWDDPKPYVFYGVVFIDSCLLRVMAGTQIYVHGGVVSNDFGVYNDGIIYTLANGRVSFEGTLDNPVVIQDDRLEPAFDDVAGQWSGIRFGPGSTGHTIEHTIIKNSIVGVQLDSLASAELRSVEIFNTAGSGVVSVHADLDMTNCLIYENGGNSLSILHGGTARVKYCTFANFSNDNESVSLSNYICYDPLCQSASLNDLNAAFFNSIVIGDDNDEIILLDGTSDVDDDFTYVFNNCLYRANRLPDDDPEFLQNCRDCVEYDSSLPLFVDRQGRDYHLDSLSQVEGLADPLPVARRDKDDVMRDLVASDMGCYEYVPR